MIRNYFAKYTPGFGQLVENALKAKIDDANVISNWEGLILFQTKLEKKVYNLPFFTNIFLSLNQIATKNDENIDKIVLSLGRNTKDYHNEEFKKQKTFRIFVLKDNQLTAIGKDTKNQLVQNLADIYNLKHSPLKADLEFWFFIRREKTALFGIKLTQNKEKYEKGELHGEITYLLNYLSEPNRDDILLDPFAGSGAIIKSRVGHFPYKKAFASDISTFSTLKQNLSKYDNVEIKNLDALHLEKLGNSSINKIITDPPWGIFNDTNTDHISFFSKILSEFAWVLKPKGITIILTSRKDELKEAIHESKQFKITDEYNILVSGKKAGVYKLQKLN